MSDLKVTISKASNTQELTQAIKERFASYTAPSKAFTNNQPLECSVYATGKSVAFEAGNSGSSVYRLRTNWCLNGPAFKAATLTLLAKASSLSVDEMREASYDLVTVHTVVAQVWDNNEDLNKILNFGSAPKAVMGILNLEEFTTKDGVAVSTFRLNRCIFNGVATDEGMSMSIEDAIPVPSASALPPVPQAIPVPAGTGLDPNHVCNNGHTVSALLGSGWTEAHVTAVL